MKCIIVVITDTSYQRQFRPVSTSCHFHTIAGTLYVVFGSEDSGISLHYIMKQHLRACQWFKGGCGIRIFYLKTFHICQVQHLCQCDAGELGIASGFRQCILVTAQCGLCLCLFTFRTFTVPVLVRSFIYKLFADIRLLFGYVYLSLIIESLQICRRDLQTDILPGGIQIFCSRHQGEFVSLHLIGYTETGKQGHGSIQGDCRVRQIGSNPYTSTDIGTETEKLVDLCIHYRQTRMNAIVQDILTHLLFYSTMLDICIVTDGITYTFIERPLLLCMHIAWNKSKGCDYIYNIISHCCHLLVFLISSEYITL